MKLARFRVRKFRNIIDSGPIPVESAVTCLVGMNEAGKTAVLTALNRLNPTDGDSFTVQQDYPRWLLTHDRRNGVVDETTPIEATFTITDADAAAVADRLGPGVVAVGGTVRAEISYGAEANTTPQWYLSVQAGAAVANLVDRAAIDEALAKTLKSAPDFPELAQTLSELSNAGDDDEAADPARGDQLRRVQEELAKVPGGNPMVARSVVAVVLRPRTPRFFYFSNYSVLEGRIDLSELSLDSDDRAASTSTQTARSLLRLAETTPSDLAGDDYENRKAELEAVGNDLTQQVFRYWKQNPNLRVRFDVDRVASAPPYGNPPGITPYLDIRVEDIRHSFTNNFNQRSSGFRWFFSFLAAFTEFEMTQGQGDFVVLLDEPGLTLHGRAQADLLGFINDRLAPAAQVMYTTHSPFMVETDKIDRVRIVEDGGPDTGATVSTEVLRVGQDSLFPLQAALGYDVVQHLFIGSANLLVEGPSDFIYLDTISRHLASKGMSHLDDDWRILPAGSANNIPSFVALIGPAMEVSVLIDGGTSGGQRLQRAIDAGRLTQQRVVEISEITGNRNSDIEDIFTPEDYLKLYNAAFGKRTKTTSLAPGDRIVKQIAEKLPDKSYDHYKPAETLLRDQAALLPRLSAETLERFAALFERINRSRT